MKFWFGIVVENENENEDEVEVEIFKFKLRLKFNLQFFQWEKLICTWRGVVLSRGFTDFSAKSNTKAVTPLAAAPAWSPPRVAETRGNTTLATMTNYKTRPGLKEEQPRSTVKHPSQRDKLPQDELNTTLRRG